MTEEEERQTLREENRLLKALVAELLPLKEQLAQATARIKELEDRLAKDSRTSSKPPSSDGDWHVHHAVRDLLVESVQVVKQDTQDTPS